MAHLPIFLKTFECIQLGFCGFAISWYWTTEHFCKEYLNKTNHENLDRNKLLKIFAWLLKKDWTLYNNITYYNDIHILALSCQIIQSLTSHCYLRAEHNFQLHNHHHSIKYLCSIIRITSLLTNVGKIKQFVHCTVVRAFCEKKWREEIWSSAYPQRAVWIVTLRCRGMNFDKLVCTNRNMYVDKIYRICISSEKSRIPLFQSCLFYRKVISLTRTMFAVYNYTYV